jgi:hypothetical protein
VGVRGVEKGNKMKRFILKMKLKWETSLISKNMQLKSEIRRLKKLLEETKTQNHKLIDQKTLDNIKIRELILEGKNE